MKYWHCFAFPSFINQCNSMYKAFCSHFYHISFCYISVSNYKTGLMNTNCLFSTCAAHHNILSCFHVFFLPWCSTLLFCVVVIYHFCAVCFGVLLQYKYMCNPHRLLMGPVFVARPPSLSKDSSCHLLGSQPQYSQLLPCLTISTQILSFNGYFKDHCHAFCCCLLPMYPRGTDMTH